MVKSAVTYMNKNGVDIAYRAFKDPVDPQFHGRGLYIFVYDMKGNNLAHGVKSKMVGKNLLEMKDNEGKAIVKSFIEMAAKMAKAGSITNGPIR